MGLLPFFLGVLAMCVVGPLATADEAPSDTLDKLEFFETRIRPVLVENCQACHGARKQKSGLRLDSLQGLLDGGKLGRAVVPGKPEDSLLILAVRHEDTLRMPPERKLTTREVVDLTRWIEMGAPWPNATAVLRDRDRDQSVVTLTDEDRKFWAFQPLAAGEPPAVDATDWPRVPIDRFLLAALETAGLAPAPPADRRTWIRRATFDLHGLPPTPEEVAAFLDDQSPDAHAHVIERLLASPRYGERWARHWLDVARYADSNGLDENICYANAFRYRDYVIEAFNDDKPYDAFVREQIAGDLLPETDDDHQNRQQRIATGFLALGAKMLACDDGKKMRMDIVDEQLSTLTQAVLGMTVGCARCHDHKFDPIPTSDYYALAGIFRSTKTMDNYKVVARWYERPVPTRAQRAKLAAHQQAIQTTQAELDAANTAADDALLTEARDHAGDYLLAAAKALPYLEHLAAIRLRATSHEVDWLEDAIVVEAENFARGTAHKLDTGYGAGIGVIASQETGDAEYDVEVPQEGNYALAVRYAAADARPLTLRIDEEYLTADFAGGVTGGWYPPDQVWNIAELVQLRPGKHTFRLERTSGPIPHVDKLALLRIELSNLHLDQWPHQREAGPRTLELHRPFIKRWATRLQETRDESDSVLSVWHRWESAVQLANNAAATVSPEARQQFARVVSTTREELAESYQRLFTRALQAGQEQSAAAGSAEPRPLNDATLEAARQFLLGDRSPFQIPDERQQVYSPETAARLTALRKQLSDLESSRPVEMMAMGVTEGPEIGDMPIHHRGSYLTPGRVVPRGFLHVLNDKQAPAIDASQSGRLQLAEWLTQPDTRAAALTARVLVNRIWRWHFGRGIVKSTDNFGRLGDPPSNGPLLEFLARYFVQHGWSIKEMHRLIMNSAAYRMSSARNARGTEIDPENRFQWRMNRRRLEAEAVRDSLLALGGTLDESRGGSVLKVKNHAYVTNSGSNLTDEYDHPRRSIYLPVVRSAMYEPLTTFDFPDPSYPSGDRATTTIAPQALFMTNSQLVHDQMGNLSQRLLEDQELPDVGRVALLYEMVFSRPPGPDESTRALSFVAAYQDAADRLLKGDVSEMRRRAWQALCRVLVSTNEFIYVE